MVGGICPKRVLRVNRVAANYVIARSERADSTETGDRPALDLDLLELNQLDDSWRRCGRGHGMRVTTSYTRLAGAMMTIEQGRRPGQHRDSDRSGER